MKHRASSPHGMDAPANTNKQFEEYLLINPQ